MKWKKLGQIFNPTNYRLPHNCVLFAKSPQAIVFDNYVRIYFSSAEKEISGKLKSHVLYVDFDKDFKKILKMSEKEVIPLGDLGCFDEHGIFPFNVYKDTDKILAYTTGWNRKISVSADSAIGFAESFDNGESFVKYGNGPILASSLNEPFLVADSFVTKIEETYHMWYIYGLKWVLNEFSETPERVYKIAYASSSNGIDWNRDSKCIISDVLGENECQALPTVVYHNNVYHMVFSYREAFDFRQNKQNAYKVGYAYSKDLKTWIRDDSKLNIPLSLEGWDSEMMCYPFIFTCDDKIYILYNGNEFGKYGFGLILLEE